MYTEIKYTSTGQEKHYPRKTHEVISPGIVFWLNLKKNSKYIKRKDKIQINYKW